MSEVKVRVEAGWTGFVLLAVLGLALFLAWRAQGTARANGLRADSLEAVADTTRKLLDGERVVWGRRMLQVTLRADSLDRLLRLKPAVVLQPVVHVDTLTDTLFAPVTGDSIREGVFRLRQAPYTLSATATLPPPPSEGRLAVSVALDSLLLGVRVGCGRPVGGIRPATATVEGPAWVTVHLDRVQGSPDVCNRRGAFPWWTIPVAFVGGAIAF